MSLWDRKKRLLLREYRVFVETLKIIRKLYLIKLFDYMISSLSI